MSRSLTTLAALALAAGALAAVPAHAAPDAADRAARKPAWNVTATVKDADVIKGDTVVVRGKVTQRGDAHGRKATLQKRYPGEEAWVTQGHATVRRDGTVRFEDTISSDRNRRYRIVMPRGASHPKGKSEPVEVTVYSWRSLGTFGVVSGSTLGSSWQITMNGVDYQSSLVSWEDAASEYTLARSCLALKATYGVLDYSPTGSSVRWDVTGDGVDLYNADFALGESAWAKVSVEDVFRIKLAATGLSDVADQGGVGTPRVLCHD